MHAGVRLGSQWTGRRKTCVQGPLRRAHPASGATWNVQVVRGKVTSRCLWHACRALSLGLLLMLLGAAMATIGYYADQLSVGQEIRGNHTVRVKNESRGFHLNNLSYAGPIVMGVGGFIVVAACVMTFEARDSAAKVVPARFKMAPGKVRQVAAAARRSAGSQTGRWEHHLGVFKSSPTSSDRRALTAAFMQFSKNLGSAEHPPCPGSPRPPLASSLSPHGPRRPSRLQRCGSVPELHCGGPRGVQGARSTQLGTTRGPPARRPRPTLLNPAMLGHARQALSVDESHVRCVRYSRESLAGSQGSMAMDLHVPSEGPVTLRVRDRSRAGTRPARTRPPNTRSDTARRHMLSRQRPIDDDEHHAPEKCKELNACSPSRSGCHTALIRDTSSGGGYSRKSRRSSNTSDTIYSQGPQRREHRHYGPPRRSASTSPHPPPRRSMRPPPASLDLSSHPIEDTLSPDDLPHSEYQSEYHTVCEEHSAPDSKLIFTHSADSRDSRNFSTETGTLHTAEINMSDDGMMEYDAHAETPSSTQTENDAECDLSEDITPTIHSETTSMKNDEYDTSTVVDVICYESADQILAEDK